MSDHVIQTIQPFQPFQTIPSPSSFPFLSNKMSKVVARYSCYGTWILPKGVQLDKYIKYPNPGSYFIKWDVLYYIDKDGVEHTITNNTDPGDNHDFKRPDDTEVEDVEDWELEEEETDKEETKN
jgi:hypothetical protein